MRTFFLLDKKGKYIPSAEWLIDAVKFQFLVNFITKCTEQFSENLKLLELIPNLIKLNGIKKHK